eukprot:1151392-Pelagomonas_calceolata.AAC.2
MDPTFGDDECQVLNCFFPRRPPADALQACKESCMDCTLNEGLCNQCWWGKPVFEGSLWEG